MFQKDLLFVISAKIPKITGKLIKLIRPQEYNKEEGRDVEQKKKRIAWKTFELKINLFSRLLSFTKGNYILF